AESSLAALTSLLTGPPQLSSTPESLSALSPSPVVPSTVSMPTVPRPTVPTPAEVNLETKPQPATTLVTTPLPNAARVAAPQQPTTEAESAPDLAALLLSVVAEKTGYPAEMLTTEMEMEADLGIDSIKRVEILSAMSKHVPGLRELKMSDFGPLRTLGQIVDYMNGQGKENPAPVSESETASDENAATTGEALASHEPAV